MYLNKINNIDRLCQQNEFNKDENSEPSLASKVRSVSHKRRPKKLGLSLTMPKETTKGSLLGTGLCGEVRRDLAHEGFVLKSFSRYSKELAQKECSLFIRIYGEGSAEVIEEADGLYLRMLEVPGVSLDKCNPSELPDNARELFFQMISDLNEAGIIHGDLHSGNIMYDRDANRFWPIDLSNAYDSYYDSSPHGRALMDIDNEKRFKQVMRKLGA
ncbi:RIO1 family regulatory kinase/ATPase [Vibrio sp.]|uniref:OspG family effector kinase n=1 Tax=Vibrio sp. TaxID=678 RepID=UPI00311FBF45